MVVGVVFLLLMVNTMKKSVLCLLFILSCSLVAFAGDGGRVYGNDEVVLKNSVLYDKAQGTPLNGVLEKYFAPGKLSLQSPYKDGLKDGIEKRYRQDGSVATETGFKKGKRDGMMKVLSKDGVALWSIPFKEGNKTGIARKRTPKGILIDEVPFKNGKIDGVEKKYYPLSGKLQKTVTYKDNVQDGPEITYAESGEVIQKRLFKDDRVVPVQK